MSTTLVITFDSESKEVTDQNWMPSNDVTVGEQVNYQFQDSAPKSSAQSVSNVQLDFTAPIPATAPPTPLYAYANKSVTCASALPNQTWQCPPYAVGNDDGILIPNPTIYNFSVSFKVTMESGAEFTLKADPQMIVGEGTGASAAAY